MGRFPRGPSRDTSRSRPGAEALQQRAVRVDREDKESRQRPRHDLYALKNGIFETHDAAHDLSVSRVRFLIQLRVRDRVGTNAH